MELQYPDVVAAFVTHAPAIGERLAHIAMEWLLVEVADVCDEVDASFAQQFPKVKMLSPQEIIEHAKIEFDAGDRDTITVGYVTDGMATEYLRLEPQSGRMVTQQG